MVCMCLWNWPHTQTINFQHTLNKRFESNWTLGLRCGIHNPLWHPLGLPLKPHAIELNDGQQRLQRACDPQAFPSRHTHSKLHTTPATYALFWSQSLTQGNPISGGKSVCWKPSLLRIASWDILGTAVACSISTPFSCEEFAKRHFQHFNHAIQQESQTVY